MKTIPNYYELEPENNIFQDVVIDVTHRCNMNCKNCYIPIEKYLIWILTKC